MYDFYLLMTIPQGEKEKLGIWGYAVCAPWQAN